jgi:hypothetical protein
MRGWRILGNFGHAAIVQAARAADGPKEWQNSTAFVVPQTPAVSTALACGRVNRLRGLTEKAPEKGMAFPGFPANVPWLPFRTGEKNPVTRTGWVTEDGRLTTALNR